MTMDLTAYVKVLAALLVLLGLVVLASVAIRRFNLLPGVAGLKPRQQRRLKLEEALILDPRRRLVILRHDDDEHLVLLGVNSDLLISSKKAETPS